MKTLKTFVLIVATAMITLEASAWGGPQHCTVGYIATRYLTPKAKEMCDYYLRHSLAYQGSWMDYVRHCEGFKHSRPWHGLYVTENGEPSTKPTGAIAMIERMRTEMGNGKYKEMPDSIVANNIRYLVHTVGEIHCPVHVAFPLTVQPIYEETTEFNRYNVSKKGKTLRLHNLWDGISYHLRRRGWKLEQYAEAADTFSDKARKKIMKGDAIAWGRDCIKEAPKLYVVTPREMDIADITKEERDAIWKFADRMVAKGGYRLAAILNEIFK